MRRRGFRLSPADGAMPIGFRCQPAAAARAARPSALLAVLARRGGLGDRGRGAGEGPAFAGMSGVGVLAKTRKKLARSERFERPTLRFVVRGTDPSRTANSPISYANICSNYRTLRLYLANSRHADPVRTFLPGPRGVRRSEG